MALWAQNIRGNEITGQWGTILLGDGTGPSSPAVSAPVHFIEELIQTAAPPSPRPPQQGILFFDIHCFSNMNVITVAALVCAIH